MVEIKPNILKTDDFLRLYKTVGWDMPQREQVEIALKNCEITFSAICEGKTIGMVRLLGDGGLSYFMKDLVVDPKYQGMGIGRMLIENMQEYILSKCQDDWKIQLDLASAKGKEPFYIKMGFESRPNDSKGACMEKIIKKSL